MLKHISKFIKYNQNLFDCGKYKRNFFFQFQTRQLDEMRKAHDNRIKRYENLQASYRLAREEMKAVEFGRSVSS